MHNEYLDILKKEIVPALGCTEPIAVALAVAEAVKVIKCVPDKIEIYVSRNIMKNGMGVGIPGTGMFGLDIAAALGAVCGDASKKLEALSGITEESINSAKKLISSGIVHIELKDITEKLYIEAVCTCEKDYSRVIIKSNHTNIVLIEHNGKIKYENNSFAVTTEANKGPYSMSVQEIYEFVEEVSIEELQFLNNAVNMNKKIADVGITSDFGLGVGKMMHNSIKKGLLKEDISSYAVSLTAAATDARMAGCMLPVMSTAGSGNQGITATMPVVAVAEKLDISREKLIRAIALSNLITIHIKSFIGRLSALCGCGVAASIGASCGITYIMGGNLESINCAIKNMIANVSGIICDGAKSGCALKIATAVSGAVQCAILAVNGTETSYRGGIVDKSIEKTIRNLADIGNEGMEETDKVILGIMAGK